LWAINLTGGFDAELAERALAHPEPQVRLWSVRLLGDDHRLGEKLVAKLVALARSEPSVHVRSQFAASAKRLSAAKSNSVPGG
jgi:hypothetical protein